VAIFPNLARVSFWLVLNLHAVFDHVTATRFSTPNRLVDKFLVCNHVERANQLRDSFAHFEGVLAAMSGIGAINKTVPKSRLGMNPVCVDAPPWIVLFVCYFSFSDPVLSHCALTFFLAKSSLGRQDAGYGIIQCLLSLSDAPVAAADAEAASNGGAVVKPVFGLDVMEPGYAMFINFCTFTALNVSNEALCTIILAISIITHLKRVKNACMLYEYKNHTQQCRRDHAASRTRRGTRALSRRLESE
jgi:hypothetical protein